jgi:hypothetical protein
MFKKNDIRSLPFDKIPSRVLEIQDQLKDERLAVLQSTVEASNNRKLKMFAKDAAPYYDSEAGSDGVEEAILEVANFDDPDEVRLSEESGLECFDLAKKQIVPQFLEAFNIGEKYTWILPQMKAHFGSWKAVKVGDKYCPEATFKENCKDDFNRGLWLVANWSKRSDLIKGQGVRIYQVPEYNHLVPLILSAFRTYQDIAYSDWSQEGLEFLVDSTLCEAMLSEPPELTVAEKLALREHGLIVRSGAKKDTFRSPSTSAMLYGMANHPDDRLRDLPNLTLVMLAQIWCAHPTNRTPHMILDPNNWDSMPKPLIEVDVLPKSSNAFTKTTKLSAIKVASW